MDIKFRGDFYSRVFNLVIFPQSQKNAKWKTCEIKYQ